MIFILIVNIKNSIDNFKTNLWTNLSADIDNKLYTTDLRPYRRCFLKDKKGNQFSFCNPVAYTKLGKHRTIEGKNSLFPIQMEDRTEALARANSAYFISIIIVQWADLMICKTRIRSLFEQGMTNTFMNFALFCETILGAFLVYTPIANTVAGTRPLDFVWWTAAVPFSLFIYIYDEIRKGWIRKYRHGWLKRNTFW